MPRDYRQERDLIVERWYGSKSSTRNPEADRIRSANTIGPSDGYGVPLPANNPYPLAGHCLVWRYSLDSYGYGVQNVEGGRNTAHRLAYEQTRGSISSGKQINHLCDRPYCFQPSHLYEGTQQDNSDDSKLFRSEEWLPLVTYSVLGQTYEGDDPLLLRLAQTPRYQAVGPWDPVEHPPQATWNGFQCRHDFAIPQQGGGALFCRICEESRETLRWDEQLQDSVLIGELWPISQIERDIWSAIHESGFMEDTMAERRRSAYLRNSKRLGGRHSLGTCSCELCVRDRRAFGEAIDGNLTDRMRMSIRICEEIKPEIQRSVKDAAVLAMGLLASRVELVDPNHVRALSDHVEACSAQELARHASLVERTLGGATYAAVNNYSEGEVIEQMWFQAVRHSWNRPEVAPIEDVLQVVNPTFPALRKINARLVNLWNSLIDQVSGGRIIPAELATAQPIFVVADVEVAWQLMEQLRFDLTGANSSHSHRPHPHADCIRTIRATGNWEPLDPSSPFEPGYGYKAADDPQKRDQTA